MIFGFFSIPTFNLIYERIVLILLNFYLLQMHVSLIQKRFYNIFFFWLQSNSVHYSIDVFSSSFQHFLQNDILTNYEPQGLLCVLKFCIKTPLAYYSYFLDSALPLHSTLFVCLLVSKLVYADQKNVVAHCLLPPCGNFLEEIYILFHKCLPTHPPQKFHKNFDNVHFQ